MTQIVKNLLISASQHQRLKKTIKQYQQSQICQTLHISRQSLSKYLNHHSKLLENEVRLKNLYIFFDKQNHRKAVKLIEDIAIQNHINVNNWLVSESLLSHTGFKENEVFDELWIISPYPVDLDNIEVAEHMVTSHFGRECRVVYVIPDDIAEQLFDRFTLVLRRHGIRTVSADVNIVTSPVMKYVPHFAIVDPMKPKMSGWVRIKKFKSDLMAELSDDVTTRLVSNYYSAVERCITSEALEFKHVVDNYFERKYGRDEFNRVLNHS